jgi:uncharacterized protein YtpQ (UPF0354 family)
MPLNDWRTLLRASSLPPDVLREAYRLALMESGVFAEISNVENDPLRLAVRTKAGSGSTMSLDNLLADVTRADPSGWQALLEQFVAATVESAKALDGEKSSVPSRDQLVPLIKSISWLEALPAMGLVTEPLAADRIIVFAFDRPQSMTYARAADLEALNISPDELRKLASENLRRRLPPALNTRSDGKSFLFAIGGNFEASLLLIDEVWDQLTRQLPGDVIVCVLARDVCLVTSTGTPGGLESLLAARDRICAGSVPPSNFISKSLLRREGNSWVEFADQR